MSRELWLRIGTNWIEMKKKKKRVLDLAIFFYSVLVITHFYFYFPIYLVTFFLFFMSNKSNFFLFKCPNNQKKDSQGPIRV